MYMTNDNKIQTIEWRGTNRRNRKRGGTKDAERSHVVVSEEGLYNHVLLVLKETSETIEA